MKKQKIYEKGITLIALVITIIVLLILAGVTLRIVMNGGIISKSQTAVDKYSEESAREKLSVEVLSYKMGTLTGEAGEIEGKKHLNEYIEEINGQLSETEDSKYYEVELDGYLFWVDKETLEIISKGPSKAEPPTEIKFSSDTDEAFIGEEKIFSLKLTPSNASKKFLKWSVDNEEIATIKNGVLTGLKEGTVKVTVTSTEDATVIATCTVDVKAIELTGITLNKTQLELGVNKTEKLKVTYEPANATYKDITWSSNNTDAVIISDGIITGVAPGTATITAISTKDSSIKTTCIIDVVNMLEISSVSELIELKNNVNTGSNNYLGWKIILTEDLDLSSICHEVDGTTENDISWEPIGTTTNIFKGSFDGKGHTISGLYINKPEDEYQGLFGYVQGTSSSSKIKIENIVLKDINLYVANYSGGLVGICLWTKIDRCGVTGKIKCTAPNKGTNFGGDIGGVVGKLDGSQISNCYNIAKITANGNYFVGGIVAETSSSLIYNCFNNGKVNGYNAVGGICGKISSNEIKYCYNQGEISGNDGIGGIVGHTYSSMNNCYSSGNIKGNSNAGGIIGSYRIQSSDYSVNKCYFLTGTAENAIGKLDWSSGTRTEIGASDNLPTVLSVINGDNAFTTDSEGNIVLNFN